MKTCAHGNRAGGRELPATALPLIGESNDKPRRIQLKRTKGWRMPANTVKVDRSTKWGNPFSVADFGRYLAVRNFENSCKKSLRRGALRLDALRGKNLACWCPLDQPCHADVLLELANSAPGGSKPSAPASAEPVSNTIPDSVNPNPGNLEAQNQ